MPSTLHYTEHWLMADFGKNLAALRKARQLTQLDLANLLEIQPHMVGRWEQGLAKPHFDYVVRLAKVLEVSLDRLINDDEGEEADRFEIRNRRLKELCKQVDKLNSQDQDIVCHFLDMAVRHDHLRRIVANPVSPS